MTLSNIEKGTALEFAVQAIENTILRSSPSYQEKTFLIESRKILTEGGVRHEIDIWVSVDLGSGYDAVFIFECRNRTEKVDKNDIIVFTEKIKASRAQRGFFVAKSFTSDAEAQARRDGRMTLLPVADIPTDGVPIPLGIHGVCVDAFRAEVEVFERGADTSKPRAPLDIASVLWRINGAELPFAWYVNAWVVTERDKQVNAFSSQSADHTRPHELPFEAQETFSLGRASINGKDIERITLRGVVTVRVIHPTVVSHFEVAKRGRAFTMKLDMAPGHEIKVAIVQILGS